MRKSTKLVALLLAVMMIVSCVPMFVSAANPTITVATVDATPSQEAVEVAVTIDGTFCAMQFDLAYDEGLTLSNVKSEDVIVTKVDGANSIKAIAEADGAANVDGATITLTFAAPEEAGTYNVAVSNVDAANLDEEVVTFDLTAGAVVVKSATVEPVLDEGITFSANPSIGSEIGLSYRVVGNFDAYDYFTLNINRSFFNTVTKQNEVVPEIVIKSDDEGVRSSKDAQTGITTYAMSFSGIAIYDVMQPITCTVHAYKDENEVAYSNDYVVTAADILKIGVASSNVNLKTVCSELLNTGAEAMKYFKMTGTLPTDGVALAGLSNFTFDGLDTTFNIPSGTKVNPVVGSAPAMKIYAYNCEEGYTMDVSYYSQYTHETFSASTPCSPLSAGAFAFNFDKIALYDSNKVVTATVKNASQEVVATYELSLDALYGKYKDNATLGSILTALARLGVASRTYFGVSKVG